MWELYLWCVTVWSLYIKYFPFYCLSSLNVTITTLAYMHVHWCLSNTSCLAVLHQFSLGVFFEAVCFSEDCVCVCVHCEQVHVWYISMSHLFLKHCREREVWICMNPGELTPVSLSARLLSRPVLHWKAASSTDNPQTMSNTDSSSALHGDIGERHWQQKSSKDASIQISCCVWVKYTVRENLVKSYCPLSVGRVISQEI